VLWALIVVNRGATYAKVGGVKEKQRSRGRHRDRNREAEIDREAER